MCETQFRQCKQLLVDVSRVLIKPTGSIPVPELEAVVVMEERLSKAWDLWKQSLEAACTLATSIERMTPNIEPSEFIQAALKMVHTWRYFKTRFEFSEPTQFLAKLMQRRLDEAMPVLARLSQNAEGISFRCCCCEFV